MNDYKHEHISLAFLLLLQDIQHMGKVSILEQDYDLLTVKSGSQYYNPVNHPRTVKRSEPHASHQHHDNHVSAPPTHNIELVEWVG